MIQKKKKMRIWKNKTLPKRKWKQQQKVDGNLVTPCAYSKYRSLTVSKPTA